MTTLLKTSTYFTTSSACAALSDTNRAPKELIPPFKNGLQNFESSTNIFKKV